MKIIKWEKLRSGEYEKIDKLSYYFEKLCIEEQVAYNTRDQLFMDLVAVHTGDCPLRIDDMLKDLAEGRKGDIGHDLSGIWNHFDRQKLSFNGVFLPRYSRSYE
jgi:hypothetical protein